MSKGAVQSVPNIPRKGTHFIFAVHEVLCSFGVGKKFITPTVTNGKVYVGTTTGVGVFGPPQ